MAFQNLSLGAAITANQTTGVVLNPVSGSVVLPALGLPPLSMGVPVLIDSEFLFVTQQTAANVYTVRGRGSDGTGAAAHDVLANVYASTTNDFGNPVPGLTITIDPTDDFVVSIGQDSSIGAPLSNSVYNINKASAAAITLSAPLVSDNGVTAVITSNTAFAHVITASPSGNIKDGVAARTTATFTAVAGATMTLVAENGAWNVLALQGVTLS